MKKLLLFLFLINQTIISLAQTTLSGRVVSQSDKQPMPFVTISLAKSNQSDFVLTTVSDDKGVFIFDNLTKGNYTVRFIFMGYAPTERQVVVGSLNPNIDLGHVSLNELIVAVEEVQVVGKQQTLSAALDKKRYTANDMVVASSGSALDMMKSLPGVVVDQQNRITLRGSDKVSVLIDGRQSSLTGFGDQRGLDNIPSSQIESIEIINNPSAKHDAAGMAGIVNIKLKHTAKRGFSGDVGFVTGVGALSRPKPDLPTGMSSYSGNMKYTPSVNLNYTTDKIKVYTQANWTNQKKLPNNEFTTRNYDNGQITESQVAENRSQNHYNVKLGVDWTPTSNQTFTLFGMYDYEWHIDTTRVWYFSDGNYQNPIRKWSFNESEGTGFTNVTLQHKYKFREPGHEINSQFLFTKGWEDETYNLYQDGPMPLYPTIHTDKTQVEAPEYVYHFSSDYTRPLPFGRFEAGVSGRWRDMPITYTMTRDPNNTALIFDFGNWSKWNEMLLGVYANLVAEFRHFDVEAGLRGEHTAVEYSFAPNQYFKDDKYNYFKLFPNVRLTWKPTDSGNHRVSLFYNSRIDRPGEDVLRIFPKYDDPELLKIGNPALRPQYTQSAELAYKYQWQSGSIYAAVYYKNIDGYYTRIYAQDPQNPQITIKEYDNLGRAENVGLEVVFDQRIAKIWNLSGSINFYQNTIFAHSGIIYFPQPQQYSILKQTDTPFFAKLSNRVKLPASFLLELSGVYFSAKNTGQGRELARGGVDIGLKKSLLKNKLELSITATDIFNTMGIRQEIQAQGFNVDYCNYYETQVVSLGVKYRF